MGARPRVVLAALAICAGAASAVRAQTDRPRLEVGGQLEALRLSDFETTNAGGGGRVSYDLSRWLTAEGEVNLFRNDYFEVRSFPALAPDMRLGYSRRRVEGFFGAKAGLRRERFGLFGKVRPGFARLYDRGVNCVGDVCALVQMLLARPEYRTELALDVGGVFEFYPTARTVARLDLGSTIIRHRSSAPPCADCTSRNFASRFGFGVRF